VTEPSSLVSQGVVPERDPVSIRKSFPDPVSGLAEPHTFSF